MGVPDQLLQHAVDVVVFVCLDTATAVLQCKVCIQAFQYVPAKTTPTQAIEPPSAGVSSCSTWCSAEYVETRLSFRRFRGRQGGFCCLRLAYLGCLSCSPLQNAIAMCTPQLLQLPRMPWQIRCGTSGRLHTWAHTEAWSTLLMYTLQ